MLFSATISSSVKDFTLSGIKDYKMVQVDKESKLSDELKCQFYLTRSVEKTAVLLYVMQELIDMETPEHQTIVFAATRHHVEYLHEVCRQAGLKTTYIFGMMEQSVREERLASFRKKQSKFLIVTDLAARGIDIPLLDNVIHYDFPTSMKLFIHRAGRTARAGHKGSSYCLLTNDEYAYAHDLSIYVGRKIDRNVSNPETFCVGSIPQRTVDEYSEYITKLHSRNPLAITALKESMVKSMSKYNMTKDAASSAGMAAARNRPLEVHP